MINKLEKYNEQIFEKIKHLDEDNNEYWFARELMNVLGYSKWENFNNVIKKAIISYKNSNNDNSYWLPEVRKPIISGKGKKEYIIDYKLPRYICYLIVQNCDPRKEQVALGQTYFAIQTRKQELFENKYKMLSEDEKRLSIRKQTKSGNLSLNKTAINAGVKNLNKFHNAGYKGLYNGETADDIAKRKKLRYREDILDNMGSTELATNLFRITQTEEKLINDNINGEKRACDVHNKMGKDIRKFIKKQGGTMPEDLPTPNKSIKELSKEQKNKESSKPSLFC